MAGGAPVLLIDDNVEFVGLLGTLFSEQGLSPVLAHSGSEALFHLDRQPHLAIVLDLLLPDTTGQRLLKAMRAQRTDLPPVFVMTGVFKGEVQRQKVIAVGQISGWYEKPFDTRLLVEKVVQVIGRDVVERHQHQKVGQVVGDFEIDILEPEPSEDILFDIDDAEDSDIDIGEQTAPLQYWDSQTVKPAATELGLTGVSVTGSYEPVRVPITESTDLGDLDQAEVTIRPEDGMPPIPPVPPQAPIQVKSPSGDFTDPFGDTSSGFGSTMTPSPAQVAEDLRTSLRSGDLSATTVPRLINAFYIAQETGEIAFERGKQRKIVYFERGRPVYAVSNQETDRIGLFAKRFRKITHKTLKGALQDAKEQNRLLVDVLVDKGLVDQARRDELLREQTRGLVRSLFTWSTGRYVVGFSERSNFQPVELVEHPGALVLSGIRDLFELGRLRELLPDEIRPIPTPNPPFGFEELPLHDSEAVLLLSVTGHRTIRELVSLFAATTDERTVRAVVYALLCLGVLGLASG